MLKKCPCVLFNFAADSHVDRSIESPYPFINIIFLMCLTILMELEIIIL